MAQFGSLCAEKETLSHVLSLVQAFRAFDSDSDGSITPAELGGIMGSLGYNPSEHDVKKMMQQGDTNRDGMLTIEEFLDMNVKELELGSLATCLRRAFEAFAFEDGDFISGDELYEGMGSVGVELSIEDCQAIIASMDGDGDGAISSKDFKLIVNSLR